jgi:hypothetical protein
MRINRYPKKILLILLLPLSMLLFYCTTFTPGFIENIFSRGINKLFIELLSLFTGLVPISIAEIGLIVLSIVAVILFIHGIAKVILLKSGRLKCLINYLINISITVSLIYFIITISWTLNYNRHSFAKIAGLDTHPASVSELSNLCDSLITRANSLRNSVRQNSDGVMFLPEGYSGIFNQANLGYENAAKTNPALSGNYGRPKSVLFSKAMSYSGIIGLYCPFTGEANIDTDVPSYSIPSTVCHEMAHQHGFAREDEANYISYLTCSLNPNVSFQYSGAMLALINSTNALYAHDKAGYDDLNKKISEGVRRDLRDNSLYWQKHKGPVENTVTSLNNAYLKANRQTDGVFSYGRMVDLLIAEYRKTHSVS